MNRCLRSHTQDRLTVVALSLFALVGCGARTVVPIGISDASSDSVATLGSANGNDGSTMTDGSPQTDSAVGDAGQASLDPTETSMFMRPSRRLAQRFPPPSMPAATSTGVCRAVEAIAVERCVEHTHVALVPRITARVDVATKSPRDLSLAKR